VIASRIIGQGPVTVTVRGERNGAPVAFTRTLEVPASTQRPWVGRMWAQARVDDLLEEIALYGETDELKNEVIDLAVAYDFVTQYTSFLAIPESELTDGARDALASARERKQQILAAHKDAVALSRSAMPPGDPILQVRAPANARQVTAYFPFGLVKDLAYEPDAEHWRVRFLVPKGVADGVYQVKIVIVHADGTTEIARIAYTIDSSEPDFEVVTEEVDGGVVIQVVTAEPARLVTVTAVDDPRVRIELADQGGGVHFEALVPLAPGRHRMRIVVADEARNEAEDTFTVDLPALH
jgi:Ca-activated chloride channel homolog